MLTIYEIATYFNPFTKNPCSKRDAVEDFQDLSLKARALTVVLTALAFIGTFFLLGTGAVAVFRLCTKKWSVINPQAESANNKTASKADGLFEEMIGPPVKKRHSCDR